MPKYTVTVQRTVVQETVITVNTKTVESAQRRALDRVKSPKFKGAWRDEDVEETNVTHVVDPEAEQKAAAAEAKLVAETGMIKRAREQLARTRERAEGHPDLMLLMPWYERAARVSSDLLTGKIDRQEMHRRMHEYVPEFLAGVKATLPAWVLSLVEEILSRPYGRDAVVTALAVDWWRDGRSVMELAALLEAWPALSAIDRARYKALELEYYQKQGEETRPQDWRHHGPPSYPAWY